MTATKITQAEQSPNILTAFIQRQAIVNGAMEIAQELGVATSTLTLNTAKYICDVFSVTPSGTAVSAGTAAQISTSTLTRSKYSMKIAGATITGSGTIVYKYRIESIDAVQYVNDTASFSALVLQDTGAAIDYVITLRTPTTTANTFTSVTDISNSGNISVGSGANTLIKYENVAMGDCSKGIEVEVKIVCGAITTKNFETSEWQMNVGDSVLPFACGNYGDELLKVMRYYFRDPNVIPMFMVKGGVKRFFYTYKAPMRITPSITTSGQAVSVDNINNISVTGYAVVVDTSEVTINNLIANTRFTP